MALDTWLFVGFIISLAILAFLNRSRLDRQPILGRFMYIALYRSKVGLRLMEWVATRFERPIRWISPFIIGLGFLGMIVVCVEIIAGLYNILTNPAPSAAVALVLPLKAKGIFYVPFLYWILSIFFVVVVHEAAHGILAIANQIKVKSSGLAVLAVGLPVVPAAFVEPDEESLKGKPVKSQLAVFAAGPFSNLMFAVLFSLLFVTIASPIVDSFYQKDGLTITRLADDGGILGDELPVLSSGLPAGAVITAVDGRPIKDLEGFQSVFKDKKPGDTISLSAGDKTYQTRLVDSPDKPGVPYLGVFFDQARHRVINGWYVSVVEWFSELLMWIAAMNLGVGLFNLLPLGIVDGGRMLHIALHRFLGEHHAKVTWAAVSGFFFFAVVGSFVLSVIK